MRKNVTAGYEHITKSEVVNYHHKKNMFIFLYSVIALSLVSLSVLATMANAQTTHSNSTSATNSTTSNETGVKQMGICVVGAKSPCNGDRNSLT
jgi:hypothetical protein